MNMLMVFAVLTSQFGVGGDIISQILSIVYILFFVVFIFYGQRIQMFAAIREVEGSLYKLKYMREEARKTAINTIKEIGKPKDDPTPRVDRFLDYFTIGPQAMDPVGIVNKLDHILDVRDERMKDEVKQMAPATDEAQVFNLENTLEAAALLNFIYKYVRHFYIQGKKTLSFYVMLQLQMILPLVMKEAEAYMSGLKAFAFGQPIGDGAGPLVAGKLMHGYELRDLSKNCVVASVPFEGRTALVIKTKGPGADVGKPGDAVKAVIEENKGKIASVIMIDAMGKLEGETVGEVAEGVGAAIGGPGVDQFRIEESIAEFRIPIYAVVIKEDIGDTVSPMRKEISDSVDKVIERIKSVILERTKEGDKVIIVGVGNTIGIGQ